MRIGPSLAGVVASVAVVVAVTVVFGTPGRWISALLDPGAAAPSLFEMAGIVLWLGSVLALLSALAHLAAWRRHGHRLRSSRWAGAATVLVTGALVLAAALSSGGYGVCCGGAGAAATVEHGVH
ncbi:MAG: hypothetical protein M3R48_05765 [Candidatus Dormibacteraeota bacterium]|nr:hypothetical protein [Candidatus Dormibacteraeota bacterium]